MKKTFIIIGVLLIIAVLYLFSYYNRFVTAAENVDGQWAQVETQYQRRADLIPNLVNTVQGAASFEQETQTKIAALRTQAAAAQQAWEGADTRADQIAAAGQIDEVVRGFQGLNINVENYPQLRATENFQTFQAQLEGTENRVSVARTRFNDEVRGYNVLIKRFPGNVLAGMFGFDEEAYFESDEGSEVAPVVEF